MQGKISHEEGGSAARGSTSTRADEARAEMVRFASHGVMVLAEGRVRYANPAAAALLGFPSPEALVAAGPVSRMVRPADRRLFDERLHRVTTGLVDAEIFEHGLERADGARIRVQVRLLRRPWNGEPAVLVFLTDITELRLAEAATRLARTFVARPGAAVDPAGFMEGVLRRLCRMLDFRFGACWVPRPGEAGVELAALWHACGEGPRRFARTAPRWFGPGEGFPATVVETGRPARIDDLAAETASRFEQREAALDAGMRCAFGVPVIEGRELLAVIVLIGERVPAHGAALLDTLVSATTPVGAMMRRLLVEQARSLSERQARDIIEHSADGLLVLDAHQRVRLVNPAAAHILNRDRTDLQGTYFGLPLSGTPAAEINVPGPDGETRTVEMRVSEVSWSMETSHLVSLRDITGRVRAERALRQSREQIEEISASNPGVIYRLVQDPGGRRRFTYLSPRSREVLGLDPDTVLADRERFFDVVHEEDVPVLQRTIAEAAKARRRWVCDFRVLVGDQVRWVRGQASAGPETAEGLVWNGFFIDITREHEAEQALRQRTLDLEERVKELHCLYGVSRVLSSREESLAEQLERVAALIPDGFHYPADTVCRVRLDRHEAASPGFRDTAQCLAADVTIDDTRRGRIEVFYLGKESPPFLPEERYLLDELASRLSQTLRLREREHQLETSRQTFRDFAEAASDWLWEMDAGLRFTDISRRFTEITGIAREDVLGKTRWDYSGVNRDADPAWRRHLEDLRAHRPFRDFRYSVTPPSTGRTVHVRVSGKPLFDERGRFLGYRGTGTDETAEIEAREQAREMETRLTGIADRLPGIVFQRVLKANGEIAYPYMSAATGEVLGIDAEELMRDPKLGPETVHPEDRGRVRAAMLESARTLEPMDVEFRVRDANGAYRWTWQRSLPRRLDNGDVVWECIELNIDDRKKAQERAEHLAYYDQTTGLPNRRLFVERLRQVLPLARRSGEPLSVAVIGLNGFKRINQSFGMTGGDSVLHQAGERFQRCLRPGDTVAHLGGDRYLLLLPGVGATGRTHKPLFRLLREMERPFRIGEHRVNLTFNMGIATFGVDADDEETLISRADTAQIRCKRLGPANYLFFSKSVQDEAAPVLVESQLRDAIGTGQLEPYYQPLVDARTGRIMGAESLVRWNHPQRGLLTPAAFLDIAEESGLIVPLGEEMLRAACSGVARWKSEGVADISVNVNLSAVQIASPALRERLRQILDEVGVEPSRLVLEITESTLISDVDRVIPFMNQVIRSGVRFAMDDFGVGYSSLSYLSRFPLHEVKVDRLFTRSVATDSRTAAVVSAIVAMARSLNLTVIGEGVEEAGQERALRQCGCDLLQGYRFGRPMPAEEFERLLRAQAGGAGAKALDGNAPASRAPSARRDPTPGGKRGSRSRTPPGGRGSGSPTHRK